MKHWATALLTLVAYATRVDLSTAAQAVNSCFALDGEICLHTDGRRHTKAAQRTPPSLVAWYSFDHSAPIDESGNDNHIISPAVTGPALFGAGSASLDGTNFLEIPNTPALQTDQFSVAMWVFLLADSTGTWRTIFGKGSTLDDLTPSLLLGPQDRRVDVRVSLEDSADGGSVTSSGQLPMRRWTHVAATCAGGVLRRFINGRLEGETVLSSPVVTNSGPMRVGKDPWRAGAKMYVDDVRVYNTAIPASDISALTPSSITGIVSETVTLGCTDCDRPTALSKCEPSRLCSLAELYSQGYHVARAQGWAHSADDFWYHNQEDLSGSLQRLALCC